MRKILYLFAFLLTCSLTSNAQLKVVAAGDVGVGTSTPTEKFEVAGGLGLFEGITNRQTGASATVLVERTDASAMLFGAGNNCGFTIDENFDFQVRSRPRANVLARSLSGGLYLFVSDGNNGNAAIGYSNATALTHRLRVNGSIQASAFVVTSDRKLKYDVKDFTPGLAALNKLNPITYRYNSDNGMTTDALQVGIFAQDLQKVAPELVLEETAYEVNEVSGKSEATTDYLSINDTGIKYILINAIKEQQVMIEELQAQIKDLQEAVVANPGSATQTLVLQGGGDAFLGQNEPNPYTEQTVIKYELPANTQNAEMHFYGLDGKLMQVLKLENEAQGQVVVEAAEFPSGTYTYSLVVDNKMVSTKKMAITQ